VAFLMVPLLVLGVGGLVWRVSSSKRNPSALPGVIEDALVGMVFFFTPMVFLFLFGKEFFPVVLVVGLAAGLIRVTFNLQWWAVGIVMVLLSAYFGLWAGFGWIRHSQGLGGWGWLATGALVTLFLLGLAVFMVAKRLLYDFSEPALALVLERRYPNLL